MRWLNKAAKQVISHRHRAHTKKIISTHQVIWKWRFFLKNNGLWSWVLFLTHHLFLLLLTIVHLRHSNYAKIITQKCNMTHEIMKIFQQNLTKYTQTHSLSLQICVHMVLVVKFFAPIGKNYYTRPNRNTVERRLNLMLSHFEKKNYL